MIIPCYVCSVPPNGLYPILLFHLSSNFSLSLRLLMRLRLVKKMMMMFLITKRLTLFDCLKQALYAPWIFRGLSPCPLRANTHQKITSMKQFILQVKSPANGLYQAIYIWTQVLVSADNGFHRDCKCNAWYKAVAKVNLSKEAAISLRI